MVALPAHLVATPVLERLGDRTSGVVLGAGATAAWVDVDGFVVAITTREVPLLPNAVALTAGSGTLASPGLAPGAPAQLTPGRIVLGPLDITWDPADPPAWDPTVPVPAAGPEAVARRGVALRDAMGTAPGAVDNRSHPLPGWATLPVRGPHNPRDRVTHPLDPAPDPQPRPHSDPAPDPNPDRHPDPDPDPAPHPHPDPDPAVLVEELARLGLATAADPGGAAALRLLFRGVRERDPEPASAAARDLLGRGPGLTPEGDDLLAAVAGTLAVVGPVTGVDAPALTSLLAALTLAPGPSTAPAPPPSTAPAAGRTTALSATLLGLAGRRRLVEPAGRLLDLTPDADRRWPAALARLGRLGHGSGRAYAAGIAVTLTLLAAGRPVR